MGGTSGAHGTHNCLQGAGLPPAAGAPPPLISDIRCPPTTSRHSVINKKLLHIPGFWIIFPLWHILRAYYLIFACSLALATLLLRYSGISKLTSTGLTSPVRTGSLSLLRKQMRANLNQVITSQSPWRVNPSFSFSIASPSSSEKTGSPSCCFFECRDMRENKIKQKVLFNFIIPF